MAGMTAAAFSLPSRFWAELTTRDFAHLQASPLTAQAVAVLPVAAIEQHGPHLPLSVDATLLQGVVDAALPRLPAGLPALFLPPQVVGLSTEHLAYPGTLSLAPATVIALWTEIGACVARAGVQKLLLLNGHGGQVSVMDIVARELRQHHGLLTYSSSWFSLPLPVDVQALFSAQEHRFGIHAGEIETSLMLALKPELVVPGHMKAGTALDASAITFTRDYLQTFEKNLAASKTGAELIDAMKKAYPQVTDGAMSLDIGAKVNKGEMKW